MTGGNFGASVNFSGPSKMQQHDESNQPEKANEILTGLPQFTKEQYHKILLMLGSKPEDTHSSMAAGMSLWYTY